MSDHKKYIWWEYWDRPILLHQKLTAWALVIGERPFIVEQSSRRRPHRGQLPDVDFDRAIVDPNYRSLFGRIADFLWGGSRRNASESSEKAELKAELAAALGERFAAAYLGEDKTGHEAIRASDGNFDQNAKSRAA